MKRSTVAIIVTLASLISLTVIIAVVLHGISRGGFAGDPAVSENEPVPEEAFDGSEDTDAEFVSAEPVSDMAEEVSWDETEAEPEYTELDAEPEDYREPLEKYKELLQVNPYVAGWLSIDGTAINDPVVYTPASQNYFLHRDLAGNDLERGTFFIAIDWQPEYNMTLIYGHNMKDGSGFGSLSKFEDRRYGMEHSKMHFDTLYEEKEYELLGVFYSQIEEEELETEEDREAADQQIAQASIAQIEEEQGEIVEPEELTVNDLDLNWDFMGEDIYRVEKDEDNGRFRYYYYTNLSDPDEFDYFVRNVKERELYDTGVEASWGDELLVLSTCSYQVTNGRFVVVGVHHRN
ncbi:MAG: class B sortase [Lachnospiraceae bacterium]|nr:class B sortase [Lachnospiraceae bacterium]